MKKLYTIENVLLGLLVALCVLTSNVGATRYYEASEYGFTADSFPDTACSYVNSGIDFWLHAGNDAEITSGPCQSAGANVTSYMYMRFENIEPGTSVKLNCSVIYNFAPLNESSTLKLYRIYDDWNNDTLTYNNQPAYCAGGTCWNVEGGIDSNFGDQLYHCIPCHGVEWDLTAGGLYGGDMPNLYNISLFLADTSVEIPSNYRMRFGVSAGNYNCSLVVEGLFEFSDVTVYVYDNYAGISGMEVQLCELDYTNCASDFTNEDGIAEFTVPFGTYRIDAEYSAVGLSHSSTFTADDTTESVSIYFNTIGPGSIGGFVYWPNGTGAPLAIINVSGDNDYTTITDLNGEYLISPIIKGNYTIQAFKAGLQSEFSTFRCTGDDSINLNLQTGITPPDGFSYTTINITTFSDVSELLPYTTIEILGLSDSCTISCFLDSSCRNTYCAHLVMYPVVTNQYGNVSIDRMPPNQPIFNEFIIYGYKAGFQDDYTVFNLEHSTSNMTNVHLYLFRSQNTSITFHELNDLQNVYVRVSPNIGAPQVGYTDAGGNITFSFTAVISSLIMNATINDVNYDPFNQEYPISGNPVYIAFQMRNRTITSFNLEGYLFDDVGNNVSGADVELRCASCTPSGSCGYRTTDADGRYYWWSVPYHSQCFMTAIPPSSRYSSVGPRFVSPQRPNTYFNMSPGLLFDEGNVTPGTVYLKLLVTDKGTGIPILEGNFDYVVNRTDGYHGIFTHTGYVYIRNLIPGSNVSILLIAPNYESISYLIPVGSDNYEANDRLSMRWIGGATTRQTTTRYDQTTIPTTTLAATTTTILLLPENMTVYEMSNESEYILDTIWNAGTACIGGALILLPAAAAIGLLVAVLFGMKLIDALLQR